MNRSETLNKLAPALVKAQREIEHAKKCAKNPFFKSKYADLNEVIEAIKEPLNDNGITFLQIVDREQDGAAVVETTLLHESGEFISGRSPVFTSKPNDPQALGSGITYSKRYGLQAICGLATEDDDGEAAMARGSKKSNLDNLATLKAIVASKNKSKDDIKKMRKYVGASDGDTLEGLNSAQISKLIEALRKK